MTMDVCKPRVRGAEAERSWEFPSQQVQKNKGASSGALRNSVPGEDSHRGRHSVSFSGFRMWPHTRTRTHTYMADTLFNIFTLQGFSPLPWWISSGFCFVSLGFTQRSTYLELAVSPGVCHHSVISSILLHPLMDLKSTCLVWSKRRWRYSRALHESEKWAWTSFSNVSPSVLTWWWWWFSFHHCLETRLSYVSKALITGRCRDVSCLCDGNWGGYPVQGIPERYCPPN